MTQAFQSIFQQAEICAMVCTATVAIAWLIVWGFVETRKNHIDANLKQAMIDRGMPADEIERIVYCGSEKKPPQEPTANDAVEVPSARQGIQLIAPMPAAFLQSSLANLPVRRGKVRDMYDLGDRVLMVATDRLSAFDWVFPNGVPDRGRVLTQISRYWFETLGERHHMLSTDLGDLDLSPETRSNLDGRSMICRKAEPVLIECVVRGYLVGSGWKDYQQTGAVCGIDLPAGLRLCEQLPEPIFTPATKAATGHDENISFEQAAQIVGRKTAETLRDRSLALYARGAAHAQKCGILLADTKFEWGWAGDELILIDEALTPDSSRFWPADEYQPGRNQPSFDKQFVREYLETTTWDKNSLPPPLPEAIIEKTRAKYIDAYERLTGKTFAWK